MRIVHLLNDIDATGNGLGNVAVDLAIEQTIAGNEVAMIAIDGGYAPLLRSANVRHYPLREGGMKRPWRLVAEHWKALNDFKPDIIHAHVRAGFLGAFPYAKYTRTPIFAHIHNVYQWQTRIFLLADRIVAVSEIVREKMRAMGCPDEKLRVVLNGPLRSPRLPEVAPSVSLEHPCVLTVAGLTKRKGIVELIEAFADVFDRNPTAYLYIVGDGAGRIEFERLASQSRAASHIVFEGFRSDPRPYLAQADVFVLASRRESFPLVILEARDAGCAIVTTDVDGIPEAVDFGAAAKLVPACDVPRLAAAIDELLNDRAAREALSRASRLNLEKFTSRQMAGDVTALYVEALRSRA